MSHHDRSTVTTIDILTIGFGSFWLLIINFLDRLWPVILIACDLQLWTLLSWGEHLDRWQLIVIVNYRSHAINKRVKWWLMINSHNPWWLSWWSTTNQSSNWRSLIVFHHQRPSSSRLHTLFLMGLSSKHYSNSWITFFF